jgi:anti-anti-sigma factor
MAVSAVDPCLVKLPDGAPILVLTLEPRGLGDAEPVMAWFQEVRLAIAMAGVRRVLIDCSPAEFVSALGLGQLLRLHRELTQTGGRLALCRLSGVLDAAFRASRLDKVVAVYSGFDEALASF